jgi:PAS domain S-box-containing protein
MILRPRIQPYLIASVACLTLVGSAAYDLYRERAQAIETARRQTAALARLLEENVHQLFRRAEAELEAFAQRPSADRPALPSDGFLSAAGPLLSEHGLDLEWLVRLQEGQAGRLQVDRPRRDAATAWRLAVGMRHDPKTGSAATAWQAQLDLQPLQRLLDTADTRNNGFATLFRRDGWLLATAPRNEALQARNWGDAPMFTQHLPRSPHDTVQQIVVRDGTERLYSYRTVRDYPLVISTGISLTDALAAWRQRLLWHGVLLTLVSVAFFAGAFGMSRTIRRREHAQQALVDARIDAERSEAFLRTLTDNLPLRIAYLDPTLRYRFVNRTQCQDFGLPRERVLGRTSEELTGQPAPAALQGAIERAMLGQAQNLEIEETDARGHRALATLLVPERGDGGRVEGLYAASLDITERFEQRRRLDAALKERETLLREVYHRVKNNLQVIQSLLRLQRRNLGDRAAQEALDESASRVRAMALVHERLYQSESLEAVSLRDYTLELLQYLEETHAAGARGVRLRAEVVSFEARIEAAIPYGLLINELVSNSLKHGFAVGTGGTVHLTVDRADVGLQLTLRDDGTGFPAGFALGADASMGLQLAMSLAAQLGGTLTAHSAEGAVFTTKMPVFARPNDD